MSHSIAFQHTVHQIAQRAPEVFARALVQPMFINEQDIMLKARIEMRFKSQMHNDWIVMAVDVRVDSVEAFEQLTECGREMFGEGDAYAGGECGFIVDV